MGLMESIAGTDRYAPIECDECGTRVVVEQTRIGGQTYGEDYFLKNVLPEKGIERIDAPGTADEIYVYADPAEIKTKSQDQ